MRKTIVREGGGGRAKKASPGIDVGAKPSRTRRIAGRRAYQAEGKTCAKVLLSEGPSLLFPLLFSVDLLPLSQTLLSDPLYSFLTLSVFPFPFLHDFLLSIAYNVELKECLNYWLNNYHILLAK